MVSIKDRLSSLLRSPFSIQRIKEDHKDPDSEHPLPPSSALRNSSLPSPHPIARLPADQAAKVAKMPCHCAPAPDKAPAASSTTIFTHPQSVTSKPSTTTVNTQ